MARVAVYVIAIFVTLSCISAYEKKCAIGPQYWCQSFQNAKDCGAVRHCTDTVWTNDDKYAAFESSTTCEWCQKIIKNTHEGIQHLSNNEDLIKSSMETGCKLFPLDTLSNSCSDVVKQYGTPVATLMKAQRYSTVCHLMNMCVISTATTSAPIVQAPLGQKRCTWGPSYWCSSLSNSRECKSLEHCSNNIWSQQMIEQQPDDNICKFCQFTMEKLRSIIEENTTEINVKNWLTGACSMLSSIDLVDECKLMVAEYADEVLILIQTNIDPGVICHLAHMCKGSTVKVRENVPEIKTTQPAQIEYKPSIRAPIDEQSKMLCHVIVRATHDLHVNEKKSRAEIQSFLEDDCQKLPNSQLSDKCYNFVHLHSTEIYAHVASNVELSKICDYFDEFVDDSVEKELPPVHCELCRFVLATTKYMLDGRFTDDSVLSYIDEQVCTRLTKTKKRTCQQLMLSKGKELINDIRSGVTPMLLCLRFQVCLNEAFEGPEAVSKTELQSFFKSNVCDRMGSLSDVCHTMMQPDRARSVQTLVQDLEGDVLCRLFGLCPKRLSFLDDLSVKDDTNKCKRCIDDFTRRKHISERLVNHSAEFLYHLCGQLPEKDKCTQAVNDSIQELIDFVRSLDPQDICIQLKMCDSALLSSIEPTKLDESSPILEFLSDLPKDTLNCTLCKLAFDSIKKALAKNISEQQIIEHIKVHYCMKTGEMAVLCNKTIETEGPAILLAISKEIDPKKACATMGICPATTIFDNCNNKCDCCINRMETHETQVNTFLYAMVNSIRSLCQHMPESASCLAMTSKFDTKIKQISLKFNARSACQLLTHCSETPVEIETLPQCQSRIQTKKEFLTKAIKTLNQNLKSLCEYVPWNKDCYTIIDRSTYDVEEGLSQMNTEKICTSKQSLEDAICQKNSPFNKLCQQLVGFDENYTRLEILFTSMFNQNGRVEKELCELDDELVTLGSCKSSFTTKSNEIGCEPCKKFYREAKSYDLSKIEKLRDGLLATCDWSLTKDYCVSWFNRVCDRMKDKVDRFDSNKYCKTIRVCNEDSKSSNDDCLINGDKCQCCKKSMNLRKDRFQSIVDEMTNVLSLSCDGDDCRSSVKETQKQTLDQIGRINTDTLCQRYGYCSPERSSQVVSYRSKLSDDPYHHIGSSIEALSQRLESSLTSDICFQYGQLRLVCEHLLASTSGYRNAYIYRAFLHRNPKLFDDDLREQLATPVNADVCSECKSAVQSTKDFWSSKLDSFHNVLIQSCERCPVKDQCKTFFDQQYQNIKTYLNTIDANQFCQSLRLCSSISSLQPTVTDTPCTTCIQRLNQRKEALRLGVDRLTNYLSGICQRFQLKPCQTFIEQLQQTIKTTIQSWNTKEICTQIGFCSTTDSSSVTLASFDQYEKYLQDQLETQICSELGPLQSWCRQILHGNHEQIQTVKINENLRDLMQIGESKDENLLSAVNQYRCENDRCQCCIDRINRKKTYLKYRATQVFTVLIQACNYCPVKEQCRKYWTDEQNKCIPAIDNIDPKQVCVRMGYCNASSLCSKMGVFQEECERVLNNFIQSNKQETTEIAKDLPKTSVIVLKTKNPEKPVDDSKATCILCEYSMKILSNYIHEGATEEEIQKNLEQVCQRMPSNLKQQCDEFVDNYAAVIIATILNESDLTKLCQKLNICTKTMNINIEPLSKSNIAACGVCDYVSTYVHFALKRDPSDASLQEALSKVCTHLSSEQTSQCEMLVQLFGPQMRHLKLDLGENFCQQLAICETPTEKSDSKTEQDDKTIEKIVNDGSDKITVTLENPETKEKIVKNLDDSPQCLICRYAVSYLDAVLKNNKSEAAIQEALEKVCKFLPAKERAECDQFIVTYGPVLVELIAEMADPDEVCRYLGICQAMLQSESTTKKQTLLGGGDHDYVRLKVEDTPFTCTICQFIISRMKNLVALNKTEEEILASLKESCDLFSVVHLKQQCVDFLDKYGPYLIQMVSSDIDPKVACQNIGACEKTSPSISYESPQTTSKPTESSTNAAKCIYGMNFWCTSRKNAELCNAVELCERLVWSPRSKNIII